jgi:hypothetical protein
LRRLRDVTLWSALLIVFVAIYLMVAIYLRWISLSFEVDFFSVSFRFHHWLSWIGTLFIALYVPTYHVLKRRSTKRFKTLLNLHVLGNLLSVLLVSMHFAQQMGRPPQFYPDLGTGIVLYPAMTILVVTGFFQRFQFAKRLKKSWRFIHLSMAVTFYMAIVVHVLHGLEIL